MFMGSLDHFREELHLQMRLASAWGATAVVINARGLHAAFGDFVGPSDKLECSDVMEQEMTDGDVVLIERSDAEGLTIQYQLPRGVS
jgi:hypothetical protein